MALLKYKIVLSIHTIGDISWGHGLSENAQQPACRNGLRDTQALLTSHNTDGGSRILVL